MYFILLFILHISYAFHYSINPSHNSFFLFYHNVPTNMTNRILYLQGDCPSSIEQQLTVSSGSRIETTRLYSSIPNLHCAVSVKLVRDIVKLDRPYVDVIAIADISLLSFFKQTACVTIQITSPTADTVSSTCHLTPFEEGKHSCLLRIQLPYSWFGMVGRNSSKQALSMSHTVSSTCNIPFYDRPQTSISLLPYIENAQAHTLVRDDQIDLSLLSQANVSFGINSLNSLFVHLSYNRTNDDLEKIEIRLWLDSRFDLITVSPLSSDEWSVKVITATRPMFYTSFLCTKKKTARQWDGYVFSILLNMKGSLIENKKLMRNEEGAEAVLHWEVRRTNTANITRAENISKVATKFRVTGDSIYALVPIAKKTDIINTGVLSGKQTSITMRVYTVSNGGSIQDVTSNSHCISAESRVLKTSPTCTTVYVDGTELRGMSNINVHVHYEQWITSISFTVWYPKLPITLWLRDPILNSISSWPITTWKTLKEARHHKRAARQFTCSNRYQQSELRVLASFQIGDERTGEKIYLSGNRDILFDVTSLAAPSIHSTNRSIATVRNINNRVIIQAVRKGTARIILKTQSPSIDYGSTSIIVSDEPVTVTHLSTLPIVEMNINIEAVVGRISQYEVMTSIETTFKHRYQHASFFYQLEYSDESIEYLDDVTSNDYNLIAHSSDERILALSHKGNNRVDLIAVDDISDPTVELILRAPSHCIESESPSLSESLIPLHIQFNNIDSSRLAVARLLYSNVMTSTMLYEDYDENKLSSSSIPMEEPSRWRIDSILGSLILIIIIILLIKLIITRVRNSRGYEKLVAPLLSRLSSSSSTAGRDEDTKEWVWLSKARVDSNSIGSRYSQKSTMNMPEESSPSYEENTQTSISYRGSEISVFISPTPVITVHAERNIGGGSWKSSGRTRTRAARHALVDSSSDHNLARIVDRSGSWRDDGSTWQTWNTNKRYEGIRESVA